MLLTYLIGKAKSEKSKDLIRGGQNMLQDKLQSPKTNDRNTPPINSWRTGRVHHQVPFCSPQSFLPSHVEGLDCFVITNPGTTNLGSKENGRPPFLYSPHTHSFTPIEKGKATFPELILCCLPPFQLNKPRGA